MKITQERIVSKAGFKAKNVPTFIKIEQTTSNRELTVPLSPKLHTKYRSTRKFK